MAGCTRDEAIAMFKSPGVRPLLTREMVARLRTLSTDELMSLCETADVYCIIESGRRVSQALHDEVRRTRRLTWGLVLVLTLAVVVAVTVFVWPELRHLDRSRQPAAVQPAPAQTAPGSSVHRYTQ
jgi:hypothetical protein